MRSCSIYEVFFFSSRRRHTRLVSDWSSDVCSSDLPDNGRSTLLPPPRHWPLPHPSDPGIQVFMLYAITALFAFQLLGEAIVQLTGLPLPGALVGTLLLLAALLLHGRLPESLEQAAGVLLQNMML